MLDILDLEAMSLEAEARAAAWEAEFILAFHRPIIAAEAVQSFLAMTDEDRRSLRRDDPDEHERLQKRAAALRKGMSYATTT